MAYVSGSAFYAGEGCRSELRLRCSQPGREDIARPARALTGLQR